LTRLNSEGHGLGGLGFYKGYVDVDLSVNTGKNKYMEEGNHRGMMANEHMRVGRNL
jgi:hypothetical protein